ncbi:hypothetical protein FRC20_000543 [Serendipita sp. 405]|nr:hypothetical protein FRC20_000543 [Serendipita sp. 405]
MQYQKLVVQHGAHNTVEIIVDISRRWNWEAQANESAIAGRLYRPDCYRNSYLSSDSPNYCTDRSDLAQASSQTFTRPYSLVVRTKNADSQDLTRIGRIPFRSPFSLTLQSIQCISSPQLLPMIKLFDPIQKLNLDNFSPQASTNPVVGPQLTHLEINMTNFSSYDLSSFLQPTLQDLRLRFRSDTALVLTRDSSTLTLPNLTTLGIEMVESPITRLLVTPAINKLILYRSQSPPTSSEWQFASWGHLSMVKELELENWTHEGDDLDAVAAFRNLSPSMAHVSKLKFRHSRVDGRALIEVLGDMSTLGGAGRKMDEVLLQRCTGISQDECLIVRSKVGSLKIHP